MGKGTRVVIEDDDFVDAEYCGGAGNSSCEGVLLLNGFGTEVR